MEGLSAGLPSVVGDRLAAYQEAMRTQRPVTKPSLSTPAAKLGKRKRGDDESLNGYDEELERDRHLNDMKLKSRFEHIFSKYSRDFTKVGDEVDILTGEVVVDNGHLQHMRSDLDLGGEHRGRLADMLDDASSAGEGEEEEDFEAGNNARLESEPDIEENVEDQVEQLSEDETQDEFQDDDYESEQDEYQDEDEEDHGDGGINIMLNKEDEIAHDSHEISSMDVNKDVWNDVPRLPGDVGYDPFANNSDVAGSSAHPLREFESGVSGQVTQLVDALQKTHGLSELNMQAVAGLKPQITIDLDPTSANYGKPVITYVPVGGKNHLPAPVVAAPGLLAELQRQPNAPVPDEAVKRPRDVAANVLSRIADAGLPTVPGPGGKFPAYKNKKAELKKRNRQSVPKQDTVETSNMDADAIPIDPALDGGLATETDADDTVAEDSTHDPSESLYPANTARPLEVKLLPPGVPFTEEDDELILELKDNRGMAWDDIRNVFFQTRRITALQYRYYTYLKPDCHNKFTEEDDKLLIQLREEDCLRWSAIQKNYFSEFRMNQLQYRYYTKLCKVRKKGWTEDEDELLGDLKDQQGLTWQQIKNQYFPDRTLGQIQYRYYTKSRPDDWKEQIAALTQEYVQNKGDSDDDAAVSAAAQKSKNGKQGAMVWNLRRRLAAASLTLTEAKRKQHAEKKRKREEKERLQAAKLAVLEEKRKVREAQNIAKLKLIRAAQDTVKSKPRLGRRDITSLSAEVQSAQDARSETPTSEESDSTSPMPIDGDEGERSIQRQFLNAITDYEDYQDPRRLMGKRPGRRILAAEEEERLRRREERQLLEQAISIGPMLLPKPALTPSLGPSAAPSVNEHRIYISPYPCALPDEQAYDPFPIEKVHVTMRMPADLRRTSFTLSAQVDNPPQASDPGQSSLSTTTVIPEGLIDPALCPEVEAAADSRAPEIPLPAPAASNGPMSKQWTIPKLHPPVTKEKSLNPPPTGSHESSKHAIHQSAARRTKAVFPFPSRSPPRQIVPPMGVFIVQKPTISTRQKPSQTSTSKQHHQSAVIDAAADGRRAITAATRIPKAGSGEDHSKDRSTHTPRLALSKAHAPRLLPASPIAVTPQRTQGRPTSSHNLAQIGERPNHLALSYSAQQKASHPSSNVNGTTGAQLAGTSVRPGGGVGIPQAQRRIGVPQPTIVDDSDSEAPSSILLLSDGDDSSDPNDASESGDETDSVEDGDVGYSTTECTSDDDFMAHKSLLEGRVLDVRTGLVPGSTHRRAETPQKQTPRSHRVSSAKTLSQLRVSSSASSGRVEADEEDDELA